MAHQFRFLGQRVSSNLWQLDEEESHHALKILRLSSDETIEVSDGAGTIATGQLRVVSKTKADVVTTDEIFVPKDPWSRCLMVGALKPGDIDDLIAPCVELGIDRIIVFRQSDTATFRITESSLARWRRICISAVKQSKRPWLVEIDHRDSLEDSLNGLDRNSAVSKWLLDPDSPNQFLDQVHRTVQAAFPVTSQQLITLVGGERGFNVRELELAKKSGFMSVNLGPWILRAKTATIAAATLLGMAQIPAK